MPALATVCACSDAAPALVDGGEALLCGNAAVDPGERCDTAVAQGQAGACPSGAAACDDQDPCTTDRLDQPSSCQAACVHQPVTRCVAGDRCCPATCLESVDADCVSTCGDGRVGKSETCDKAIPAGQSGACPTSCDDGVSCTRDTLVEQGTCRASCEHKTITGCTSGDGCCPAGCNPVTDCDCPPVAHTMPVLVLRYFPTKDGTTLDADVTGIQGKSLTDIHDKVSQLDQELVAALEKASTYHGYKDPQAQPSMKYVIVADREYHEPIPLSNCLLTWDGVQHLGDFVKILEREKICDLVKQLGVREVWLWGYHHGDLAPAESKMGGPNGDISNSTRYTCPNGGDPVILPNCGTTYVLYNYNYGRGLDCALENHTHQIEAVMAAMDLQGLWGLTKSKPGPQAWTLPYGETGGVRNGCGWTHCPPNVTISQQYDWFNPDVVFSDCEDWNPQRSGPVKPTSCSTWNTPNTCALKDDGGVGFKIWWMQNLPGRGHDLQYTGRPLRNWWDVVADLDQVIASGSGLLCP